MADGSTPSSDAPPQRAPRRSRRQARTAARILQKEARRILKWNSRRIAMEPTEAIRASIAAIDTHRNDEDTSRLEQEAERLDDLLQKHASFARKSALRETIENIGLAVIVALGLRACLYEPFKIPSGSMMPTLRKGDHIFVNKFTYGIQIPLTSTVVGESLGEIQRGDVIVFRYPINPSEDYIKRVIGLPGDEVRINGREVAIKRPGEADFDVLPLKPIEGTCYNDDGQPIDYGCQLFEETLDGRTHVIRYMSIERDRQQVWKVPERHLLVMGDNRDQSHDSLAWELEVQAVVAEQLLSERDLRDATSTSIFTLRRGDGLDDEVQADARDPQHDHIAYVGTHRSRAHDLALSVWRDPFLPAKAIFDALSAQTPSAREVNIDELLRAGEGGPAIDRALAMGARIDALAIANSPTERVALAYFEPTSAVLAMRCGNRVCQSDHELALRLTEVVARFEQDHDRSAPDLLERRPEGVTYHMGWASRTMLRDRYHEARFRPGDEREPSPRREVRLQVFRRPKQDLAMLEDAALRAVGETTATASSIPVLGEHSWLVERDGTRTLVLADEARSMLAVLTCGRSTCSNASAVTDLGQKLRARLPKAAALPRAMRALLTENDLPGLGLAPGPNRSENPFDAVNLDATVQGDSHRVELELWHEPNEGLAAKLTALRSEYDLQPDNSIAEGGATLEDPTSYHYAFTVPESQTVVRVRCFTGLCESAGQAQAIARRVAQRAAKPATFIDEHAKRPQPFVPRGNVKGRAERIWWPTSRFGLPIR